MAKRVDLANGFESAMIASGRKVASDLYGTTRADRKEISYIKDCIRAAKVSDALERRGLWLNRNADVFGIAKGNEDSNELGPNAFYHNKESYEVGKSIYDVVTGGTNKHSRDCLTVIPSLNGINVRIKLIPNPELFDVVDGGWVVRNRLRDLIGSSVPYYIGNPYSRQNRLMSVINTVRAIEKYAVEIDATGILLELPIENRSTVMDDIYLPLKTWTDTGSIDIFTVEKIEGEITFNEFFTNIMPVLKRAGRLTPAIVPSADDKSEAATAKKAALLNSLWK